LTLSAEPEGLLAARLVDRMIAAGPGGLLLVARGEARAARLHRAVRALAPAACGVVLLPGWDCLPYDRVSPSRAVMGRRMALPGALAAATGPRLLVASAEAASQRLVRSDAGLSLACGDAVDPVALRRRLLGLGYLFDERVDEPGEAAIHGEVVDVFPPAGSAWRLRIEDGRIAALQRIDIVTQRSSDTDAPGITIGPASELVLPDDHPLLDTRPPGLEHALPAFGASLAAPLALLPDAAVILDDGVPERLARRREDIAEASARVSRCAPRARASPRCRRPRRSTSTRPRGRRRWPGACRSSCTRPPRRAPRPASPPDPTPEDAFIAHAAAELPRRRVAIAGGIGRGGRRLARRAATQTGAAVVEAADWPALCAAPPGSLVLLAAPADLSGFETEDAVVTPWADIRPGATATAARPGAEALLEAAATLQPGDAVIHLDHGLAALRGVEAVEAGGACTDCLRLDYADGARLVPFDEFDRLWRYGAEADGLTLDRLEGGTWPKRRAETEAKIAETARALIELVKTREAAKAPRCSRPKRPSPASPRASRMSSRPTRRAPPPPRWPTSPPAARWIAWSAAMSASARPRSRCAPPVPRRSPAGRLRCSRRPRCWCASTSRPSAAASRASACASRRCPASPRPPRPAPSARRSARARSPSPSAPRRWPRRPCASATSAC
jgi:transcription-repair coupling factor (superfamily II helicase)